MARSPAMASWGSRRAPASWPSSTTTGSALTGEASEELLKRILLGAAAGIEPAGAARVSSVQAEQVIRTVQQWLAALGYRVGRVDGRLGEDTVKAIRDFEMDKGLVPKGRVSRGAGGAPGRSRRAQGLGPLSDRRGGVADAR